MMRRPRRGVTLLELIVVVIGLGMISSVAMLAMPGKVIPPDGPWKDSTRRVSVGP